MSPRATRCSTVSALARAPRYVRSPVAGSSPISAASNVVLPAPFGPMTDTIVPRSTLSEMSRTASTLP